MPTSKDERFLRSALALAEIWSKDPSSKVAALAVGEAPNQVAWGYNGFPPGIEDTSERLNNRDIKYKLVVHAEINALHNAPFPVHALYVTHHPCAQCAIHILARRTVKRIVYVERPEFETRWAQSLGEAKALFAEAGVTLTGVSL